MRNVSFNKNEKTLKQINWQYLVSRREALLFKSITDDSYRYFRKAANLPWKVNFIIRSSEGEVFHKKEDLEKLRLLFLKGGIPVLSNFLKRLILHVRNLDRIALKIERTDCSKLTRKKLVNLLEEYFNAALYAQNFLAPMPPADRVLSENILGQLPEASKEKKQEWLNILTSSVMENEHIREERSFYNLIKAYDTKRFENLLENHLKKFAWIGARGYNWRNSWKKNDILDRIKSFLMQEKSPEKEIGNLNDIIKEKEDSSKKLLKELNIKKSSTLYKLIFLAKEYSYRRTWRSDIIYRAGYNAKNIFEEVARRAGIKLHDLEYFTFNEVIQTVKTGIPLVSPAELRKRKEYYVLITIKNKSVVLAGKKWKKKFKEIVHQKAKKTTEIKGNIAFPGKAKGIVKIVYESKDIKKIRIGDIMVAVMTFPHFVPAMEKAAAFVTDEGGILCHAAIVSREMRKPCIIGTKVATKALKDNDLVEVDAEKGIVRKMR